MDRDSCVELDRQDPLAHWRDQFECPEGVVYLDGNSLGALPKATGAQLARVVRDEWGTGLIRSWNAAHWIDAPQRIGGKIARLVGAEPDEVLAADSTSVNLFKLLAAALRLRPDRPVILTEASNFPTDRYIAEGLVDLLGARVQLRVVERAELTKALDERVAVLTLTHVDYGSALIHDMQALTEAAHRHGALALWDLSHSAGAVPIDLNGCQVDLAVGCGYKYLNGGPGAPAYLFVARRWQDAVVSPLPGWMGHANPFAFEASYRPASGIARLLAGTPPILAMAALEAAVDLWLQVDQEAARRKSQALGEVFIQLVDSLTGLDLEIASPRQPDRRGSHVSVRHPHAPSVMQALIYDGVIGDFRQPDLMRFGFAALYTRYVDVWDAVTSLGRILRNRTWARPEFARLPRVTWMLRVRANRATLLLAIGIVTPLGVLMVNLAAFVMEHLDQFRLVIAACALISSLVLNSLAVFWLIGVARRRQARFLLEYPELVRGIAAIAVVGSAAVAAYLTYVGMRDPRRLPNLVAIVASLLALLIPFAVAFFGRLVVNSSSRRGGPF